MQSSDYLKAFAVGLVAVALNLLALVALVFGYSQFIEPGRPAEFYSEVAPRIGAWSGPIGGALITFLLVWVLSRRRPQRNAYAFAGTMFVSLLAVDTAIGLAVSPASELFRLPFLISMMGVCAAAFAAAYISELQRPSAA